MKQISKLLLTSAFLFSTQAAFAAERVWSPQYSCQTMKQLVLDRGSVLVSYPLRINRGFELVFSKNQRQQCEENASYNNCKLFRVQTSDVDKCAVGYIEAQPPEIKFFHR
nr:hypothetical protein [uncultured Cohaesibacter sp.]